MVDSLSKGQIGYVHIASMNSNSFRKAYSEILGRYRNRKAIIIDTRYNGGGWLHEDLIHLLSGKQFATFVPRGQFIGIDPFAQWTKPSAVLISESNYSNAHGFPWAYKELGLGKLIGHACSRYYDCRMVGKPDQWHYFRHSSGGHERQSGTYP